MRTPTSLINRPRRAAATAGALLAVSAATAMAVAVGTAAAAEPGRCVTTVNVRAEPTIGSAVVGQCAAGTAVQVGDEQNGFVELAELGGWAAAQYVAVDGGADAPAPTPAAAGDTPVPPADDPAPAQKVVVDGVDRTPADGQDADGIGARSSRTWTDEDGTTHRETTWSPGTSAD
jgi:hypothetical protein